MALLHLTRLCSKKQVASLCRLGNISLVTVMDNSRAFSITPSLMGGTVISRVTFNRETDKVFVHFGIYP